MKSKKYWKVWLRPNLLTEDVDNDYYAEVSTSKNSLRNEDIAELIVKERSEIKYDTLLSVLNQADRIVRESLEQGYSVMTGNVHITPRISGAWIGSSSNFDPEVHKMTCDMIPTKVLRETLAEIGVEVLGVRENTGYIGLVTNGTLRSTNNRFAPGEDVIIEGDKIKVFPFGEGGCDVVFIEEDGTEHAIPVEPVVNDPKRVITRFPNIPQPENDKPIRLVIRTRYTPGSKLLKTMREIEYEELLILRGTVI